MQYLFNCSQKIVFLVYLYVTQPSHLHTYISRCQVAHQSANGSSSILYIRKTHSIKYHLHGTAPPPYSQRIYIYIQIGTIIVNPDLPVYIPKKVN